MNTDWQTFLTQQNATLANDVAQHFGDPAAELVAIAQSTVMCDLGQFSRLRASGSEAQSFLQNLLSNDIREVSASRAQYSSFNTAKGRMLATFLIWRDGDDYLLQLPTTLAEALKRKLSMYVLRTKVKITDASIEVIALGLSGASAQQLLLKHCSALPEQTLDVAQTDDLGGSIIRLDDTRFQLNTTPEHAPALWLALSEHAKPVGSPCWDWLNVRAGIPVILPQTQEQFVPQMANLDLIGGINFKKGCYPGQEIVARMHYLGKLKRRMYLAHVECDTAPQAGDELFSADMPELGEGLAQPCGMIANAAAAPAGGYDVLAVIQSASHDTRSVHLVSLQGVQLVFAALPYTLP